MKESDPPLRSLLALLPEEGIEQNFICFSAFVAQTGKWKREREIESKMGEGLRENIGRALQLEEKRKREKCKEKNKIDVY